MHSDKGWAIVTGASSGMRLAFARELARRGHSVLAVARRGDRTRRLRGDVEPRYFVPSSSILRIRRSAAITLSSRLVKRSSASRLETRPAVVVSATSMRLRRRSARSVYPWNSVSSLVSRPPGVHPWLPLFP